MQHPCPGYRFVARSPVGGAAQISLLNVSYDPTRELWRDINKNFIAQYEKEKGVKVTIKQSHGGSSTQARAVIDGLDADVATLASYLDDDAISKKGLIRAVALSALAALSPPAAQDRPCDLAGAPHPGGRQYNRG
jgi:sulfate transport system substrate-binding protein